MNGWIKLHRKFLSWEWFDYPEMIKLFLFLLLMANHEDNKWRGVMVKRGQYITGIKALSKSTKLSIKKIRTCLDRLEKTGEIGRQRGNLFSIITIYNYDSYQTKEEVKGNLKGKQGASKGQARGNKQEDKEDKEVNNKYEKFILFFNEKTGKNFRGDLVSKKQFNARLNDGFDGSDFRIAIENMMLDKYLKENPRFITPMYITRVSIFEKQLNAIPASKRPDPKNRSVWTIHDDEAY